MKIGVVGLWHLGTVTAACLSHAQHSVIAYDPDENTIENLKNNQTPVFEPGLDDLLIEGNKAQTLTYTSNPADLANANIVWVAFDTPVDDHDIADTDFVTQQVVKIFPYLAKNTLLLISSQLPVGTTRQLNNESQQHYPDKNITFAYSPENLRLGNAINVFTKPERIVVGLECEKDKERIQNLLAPFSQNIIWMSVESAEMTKHALNAFLATSIVFINELATLCEKTGANARDVELGLKSEARIGPKAYLRAGGPIAGGTLARDVNFLMNIGQKNNIQTPLFSSLLVSNDSHKQWSCRKILDVLKNLKNKTITTLGLTYKVGTDTLRRSAAVEACLWLHQQGAKIVAYDPALKSLPSELSAIITLKNSLQDSLQGADAIVVSSEYPEFTQLTPDQIVKETNQAYIFDPSSFLLKILGNDTRLRYFAVGQTR